MTLDQRLFLIPGLFTEPTIDVRYKAEPPTTKPREELTRFSAQCRLEVIGELANVRQRWSPDGDWTVPKKIAIAAVSGCRLSFRPW